ncbi:MAG: phosphoribosylglycinamide formyltransferase [Aliihoeflea sp.]
MTNRKKRVAILISGRGSNMAALIAAAAEPDFPAEIAGVIADRTDARGLERAGALGVPVQAITPQEHPDKQALDSALDAALGNLGAEYVCLAGYMRLLSPAFVEKWSGRLINIHPSLLPLFKGLDSHRSCLEAGMRIHGCTVHFVTAEMDAGPIIAQAAVPVLPTDDEDALSARVLKAEHDLYPLALQLVLDGKVRMEDGRAVHEYLPGEEATGTLFSPAHDVLAGPADIESLARFTP